LYARGERHDISLGVNDVADYTRDASVSLASLSPHVSSNGGVSCDSYPPSIPQHSG
jgi:hypothetical protein